MAISMCVTPVANVGPKPVAQCVQSFSMSANEARAGAAQLVRLVKFFVSPRARVPRWNQGSSRGFPVAWGAGCKLRDAPAEGEEWSGMLKTS